MEKSPRKCILTVKGGAHGITDIDGGDLARVCVWVLIRLLPTEGTVALPVRDRKKLEYQETLILMQNSNERN